MSVKTLQVDGKMLTGVAGETLFTVAWNNGIHIPRLCHIGGISDVGACRLCLVEIEGQKKLQASCLTAVEEGMVVHTDTPKLRAHRRLIVELLFAERNHVCSVCVMNGDCELQDLATELGIDHVRVRYQFPSLPVDITHERFGLDHNRCILCTRCVRVCWHIEGAGTKNVSGRGSRAKIITDLNMPWAESDSCTNCGKCVQSCPTGALFHKGSTVGEMDRDRGKLEFIVTAREKKLWIAE